MPDVVTYQPAVRRFVDREQLGIAAGAEIASAMRRRLRDQGTLRMVFASAPSQESTLRALSGAPELDWSRVTAFHLDEYLGLRRGAPQQFGSWLSRTLFERVPIGRVHLMNPGGDARPAVARYSQLLSAEPIDIVCLGIGVNGHLAFNEPPADFSATSVVKVVELDVASRQQQVDDGCFEDLDDVPHRAITLTIPTLLSARELYCMVPGEAKRSAVSRALNGPVTEAVPASALRLHPHCMVFVDRGSDPDQT